MYLKKNGSIKRHSLAAVVSTVALLSVSPNVVAADEAAKLADLQRQIDLLKSELEQQQAEMKSVADKQDSAARLVRSGLDDTMRTAYQSMRQLLIDRPEIGDLRTAAYVLATERIASSYTSKGL